MSFERLGIKLTTASGTKESHLNGCKDISQILAEIQKMLQQLEKALVQVWIGRYIKLDTRANSSKHR